jgi:hypothetical protein
MAAPNIVNVTTITGKTAVANVSTTAANVVVNTSSSNKVVKVNSLYVSNANTGSAANVTVEVFRSTVGYGLLTNGTVPAGAAITVVDKNVYLEEGDAIRLTSSANGILQVVCSYEEIS